MLQAAVDELRNYSARGILTDGSSILIRAIVPEDRQRLRAHFQRLSPESAYFRFIHDSWNTVVVPTLWGSGNLPNVQTAFTGPGVDKKTSVGGQGTSTWKLTLKKGTYKYVCDPHASIMKGSFTVS